MQPQEFDKEILFYFQMKVILRNKTSIEVWIEEKVSSFKHTLQAYVF